MREYYDFYFVPYDLLWNKANTVLTQMFDNPQHAVSADPTANFTLQGEMPYLTCEQIAGYLNKVAASGVSGSIPMNYFTYNRGLLSAKLLEYLGYGNFYYYAEDGSNAWSKRPMNVNLQLNIFGLLAYQKIYSDFYRDSQWEKISPATFNVDFMSTGSMNYQLPSNIASFYNLFDLRYCNWQKDLFHGVVPHQQYGDTASVTVTGKVIDTDDITSDFNILALRQAEFLQKWKEITQSGNKDYKEQVEKHWNVSPGDGFSEMCTYLGGVANSLDINEVVNNNITGDNAADIAGKGTGVANGRISFDSKGRYGLILCIYHCLPLLDYTTDLVSPVFTRINAADYAIPEFDRVGMQSVPLVQMMNPPRATWSLDTILGYAPRYVDYKTDVDSSVGAFKTTLNSWVISYGNVSVSSQLNVVGAEIDPPYSDVPLTYTFFKVNPNCLNPIFAVDVDSTVDTDNFLCSSFFDVKVVRNLDTDGLPY